MKYYLAIDLGASSGRHIVGWKENGELKTEEVYRFSNGMTIQDDHRAWDIDSIEQNVRAGLDEAISRFGNIYSLSIDSWAVDYVLIDKNNEPILPCYAYRDERTIKSSAAVHSIIPFEELYKKTGIQYQPFNTVYQLYDDLLNGRLEQAEDYLLIPEYLMFRLTGVKKHEYTNATSGGYVNAYTKDYDREIISRLGLPEKLFKNISQPGETVGEYKGIKVVLCATHDTASAVEGTPMRDDSLFLSSGTWSLLGAKIHTPITSSESLAANYTNEGGVGYIRYLKNITGLWIIQNLQKELGGTLSFPEMSDLARTSSYEKIFDVNNPRFSTAKNMRHEIEDELKETLSDKDLLNTVYRSLAFCYGKAIKEIEALTGKYFNELTIVGGGAKNTYLNELTEQFTGKKIIPLPIEATAIGNLKIQMEADK